MSTATGAATHHRTPAHSMRERARSTATSDRALWAGSLGVLATVSGNTVRLTGRVRSWEERESVAEAAKDRPGVTHVENLIAVVPDIA